MTRLLFALALLAGTLLVYAPARHFEFLNYDDNVYVTDNPRVQRGLTADGARWALFAFENGNWHPVTLVSHMLDVELFGLDPAGHHVVNVLLHAANAVALFWILAAATGRSGRSALLAALFAVHPLNVQSVAWIAERKNLLCTLFWLLALGAYGAWRLRPGGGRYLLVVALAVLALAAKPMAVTLPLTLLIVDFWPFGGTERDPRLPRRARPLLEKAPLFALAGAASLLTLAAQRSGGALQPLASYTLVDRLGNAVNSYGWYLEKLVWPARLAAFYPHPMSTLGTGRVALWGAALVALSIVVLARAKRAPSVAAGWAWYLVTLLPVIGLVQVGSQAFADRYAYVPLIGVLVMIVWPAAEWAACRRAAWRVVLAALAVCWLSVLALAARHQLEAWQSSVALFERATRVVPENALAHNNLGMALVEQHRLDLALGHFREAVEIAPWNAAAQLNLGNVLNKQGRPAEARAHYEMAVRHRPGDAGMRFSLGKLLAEMGEPDAAIAQFDEAVRLDPGSYPAHLYLGMVLYRQRRLEEARRVLGKALVLDPSDAEGHYALGLVLAASGRGDEALYPLREALRLRPDDRRFQSAVERLARPEP